VPDSWCGTILLFSDGTRSTLKQESHSGDKWQEARIPANQQVRKIVVYGDIIEFGGVELFDEKETLILKTGHAGHSSLRKTETILQEGERLLGTTGYKRISGKEPRQDYLQFVIGRLE